MLLFRFIILFGVTTGIDLHTLILKNKSVLSCCPLLQHYVFPLSETLNFSSCLFKAPSSQSPQTGQVTRA